MMKRYLLVAFSLLFLPILVSAKVDLASQIEIDGIGNAPLDRNSWTVSLTTTLDYTDIKVTTTGDDVTVEGAGKVTIEEGSNEIPITLKKGDTTETYTIYMTMKRPKTDTDGNPETGSKVPYAVIALGAAAVIGIVTVERKSKFKRI